MLTLLTQACGGIGTEENVGIDDKKLRLGLGGKQLFEDATFDGNGRTCATCHGAETGTISAADAAARFAADPNDPLFRPRAPVTVTGARLCPKAWRSRRRAHLVPVRAAIADEPAERVPSLHEHV